MQGVMYQARDNPDLRWWMQKYGSVPQLMSKDAVNNVAVYMAKKLMECLQFLDPFSVTASVEDDVAMWAFFRDIPCRECERDYELRRCASRQ